MVFIVVIICMAQIITIVVMVVLIIMVIMLQIVNLVITTPIQELLKSKSLGQGSKKYLTRLEQNFTSLNEFEQFEQI